MFLSYRDSGGPALASAILNPLCEGNRHASVEAPVNGGLGFGPPRNSPVSSRFGNPVPVRKAVLK
jgi:hypothetical protein